MAQRSYPPLLLLAIAILLWSTQAVVTKELVVSLGGLNAAFYMFLFTGIGALMTTLFMGRFEQLKTYSRQDFIALVFIAGLWAIGSLLYYHAFTALSSAEAISIRYLWPVFVVAAGILVLKEKVSVLQWIGLFLGFAAIYVLIGGGLSLPSCQGSLDAPLLVLASALFWALFLLYQKKFNFEVFSSTLLLSIIAFLIVAVFAFFGTTIVVPGARDLLLCAYFGIVTAAMGNAFYTKALSKRDTGLVSIFSYLTPFLGLIWSALILKEALYAHYFIGLAMVLAAAILGSPDSNKIVLKYVNKFQSNEHK